jgi:hypothetical protein
MTDLDIYQPPAIEPTRLVMTPQAAKELDDQLRACTVAVLRDGTDYGAIPGTGERKVLFKSGAEKLLQWFGLAFTMECLDIERDDEGSKQGATYRCGIVRRLSDGGIVPIAACEGYAGYEEAKFFKPVTDEARVKAEKDERRWAAKDRRPANPNKWQKLEPYRVPWNTILKMAQKRALVGATIYATAAGGLFTAEEDASPAADDGSTWYEQALETAGSFTDPADEGKLYVEAARAHRDGLCNKKQQDEVQHAVRKRGRQLKNVTVVEAEDLGRQADTQDEPGTATPQQLTKLHTTLTGLGFGADEREQKLVITEAITGRPLGGTNAERSSKNLSLNEARKVIDTLDGMNRDQLIAWMAEHDQQGGSDET